MRGSRVWLIEFPVGMPLLNTNKIRGHWSKTFAATRNIRRMANILACNQRIPKEIPKVRIRGIYRPPDQRRRDSSNWFPTLKAAVDGLVDARVIKDDSDKYVIFDGIHPGEIVKKGQFVIEITEYKNGGSA